MNPIFACHLFPECANLILSVRTHGPYHSLQCFCNIIAIKSIKLLSNCVIFWIDFVWRKPTTITLSAYSRINQYKTIPNIYALIVIRKCTKFLFSAILYKTLGTTNQVFPNIGFYTVNPEVEQ